VTRSQEPRPGFLGPNTKGVIFEKRIPHTKAKWCRV
jgi:hypothetical protein